MFDSDSYKKQGFILIPGSLSFLNGPNQASIWFISILFTVNIAQIWHVKRVDGVLGTRTQGGRMEGADDPLSYGSTPPKFIS